MATMRDFRRKVKLFLYRHRSEKLYHFCRRYIHLCDSDNDGDMETNGELLLLKQLLPGARIVFDVGANVGTWAKLALKTNPNVLLHCFEPSRNTYEALLANRFPSNVILTNYGLGSESCNMQLHILYDGCGANSLYRRQGVGWETCSSLHTETVKITTLDDYCSHNAVEEIDLLKIDTEGHEIHVLKGGMNLLKSKRIHAIQFEYGGAWIDSRTFLRDLWNFVKECDPEARFFKIHPDGPHLVNEYRQNIENFQLSNWLILADQKR